MPEDDLPSDVEGIGIWEGFFFTNMATLCALGVIWAVLLIVFRAIGQCSKSKKPKQLFGFSLLLRLMQWGYLTTFIALCIELTLIIDDGL
jgi:hypothetical protein